MRSDVFRKSTGIFNIFKVQGSGRQLGGHLGRDWPVLVSWPWCRDCGPGAGRSRVPWAWGPLQVGGGPHFLVGGAGVGAPPPAGTKEQAALC